MNRSVDAPPDSPEGETEEKSISLGQAVGKAAGLLGSEALSNGDRAELRRISPDEPFTPALWNVLLRLERDGAPVNIGDESAERRWATLLMAMTHCVGLHEYGVPLGKALADAGWSELRFVQLMRATGTSLDLNIRRVAQYLAQKSAKANWADVAGLLFAQSGERGDEVRLRIARSYYRAVYSKEQKD